MTNIPDINHIQVESDIIAESPQDLYVRFAYPDSTGAQAYVRVDLRHVSVADAANAVSVTPLAYMTRFDDKVPGDILITRSNEEPDGLPGQIIFYVLMEDGQELVFAERNLPI